MSWSPHTYSGFSLKDPYSTKASKPNSSPFAKFQQLEKQQAWSHPKKGNVSSLCRNLSMPASPRPVSLTTPRPGAARSSSGAKELILSWVQTKLMNYPIPITNFSSCWNDGLAFCALIHVFYPDSFDWFALNAENRRFNFTLAFEKAEELADISPLLEVEDMVRFQSPDWMCVFTYVQSFYRMFREDRIITHRQKIQGDMKVPNPDTSLTSPTKETVKEEVGEEETEEDNIDRRLSHPDDSKLVIVQDSESSNQENTSPAEETSEEETSEEETSEEDEEEEIHDEEKVEYDHMKKI